MFRTLRPILVVSLALLSCVPVAYGRGGGGGGGGGGGRGGGGGFGGGGGRGGFGGFGGMGGRFGMGPGGMAAGMGGNRFGSRGKNNNDQSLRELEDRVALIAERRQRLADADRVENQEARLAAARANAAFTRVADDVR
ncbi:MAG: hypothetical protein IT460_13270 [Planctomycetes bacterium]|nr:hypothetical protein [Planctomycetota bacterium]